MVSPPEPGDASYEIYAQETASIYGTERSFIHICWRLNYLLAMHRLSSKAKHYDGPSIE